MRDEALIEGAVADAVPHGTSIAEVADLDFEGDARAAALDLSLADGRFAPDVLEIAARRAVSAHGPRRSTATTRRSRRSRIADAVKDLLHPGDPSEQTRLVVRGPQVTADPDRRARRRRRPADDDDRGRPRRPTLHRGPRHGRGRSRAASRARPAFTEHWTLALDGDAAQPWRIAAVGAPEHAK